MKEWASSKFVRLHNLIIYLILYLRKQISYKLLLKFPMVSIFEDVIINCMLYLVANNCLIRVYLSFPQISLHISNYADIMLNPFSDHFMLKIMLV